MSDIPEDVLKAARDLSLNCAKWFASGSTSEPYPSQMIARAIMAEREHAIAAIEAQKAIFASDEYATPQPLGGLMERFAYDQCIAAIRSPRP